MAAIHPFSRKDPGKRAVRAIKGNLRSKVEWLATQGEPPPKVECLKAPRPTESNEHRVRVGKTEYLLSTIVGRNTDDGDIRAACCPPQALNTRKWEQTFRSTKHRLPFLFQASKGFGFLTHSLFFLTVS